MQIKNEGVFQYGENTFLIFTRVLLASIVSLMLTCCKGNQQHDGQNVQPASQKESAINPEGPQDTAWVFLVSSYKDISRTDFKWIKEIERKFPTRDSLRFWFKYDCLVDGYQVTGRFSPVDARYETGKMVMRFDNGDKVFYYQSIWDEEFFTCSPILYMRDDSFKGWKNKALYSLHYFKPEDDEHVDRTHPLGFHTPFQFFDINFDGQKELMISDCGMFQGGNMYYTYAIDGNQLKKIDSPPIREVQTFSAIDFENKTITLIIGDGPTGCSIRFKKGQATKEPTFQYPSDWVGADIYKEYKDSWKTSSFTISSIQLYDSGETIDLDCK